MKSNITYTWVSMMLLIGFLYMSRVKRAILMFSFTIPLLVCDALRKNKDTHDRWNQLVNIVEPLVRKMCRLASWSIFHVQDGPVYNVSYVHMMQQCSQYVQGDIIIFSLVTMIISTWMWFTFKRRERRVQFASCVLAGLLTYTMFDITIVMGILDSNIRLHRVIPLIIDIERYNGGALSNVIIDALNHIVIRIGSEATRVGLFMLLVVHIYEALR